MKFWNRKKSVPGIEFFNSEPSVCDTYPIIESKDLKLDWVREAKKDFQERAKKGEAGVPAFQHLSRCPGVFDLFKYGYIVPLSKDISIIPKRKGFEFKFSTRKLDDFVNSFGFGIEGQSTELLAKPPWSADFMIKINTGWHVVAPKGVKFLILPIAFPDTFDFTGTTGILNPALSTEINPQLYWNTTEPETIIRAGTPLAHLIPLTEKKYEWTQRTMNQQDKDWVLKFNSAYDSTFWHHTMRGKVAAMYNEYWKRK